MKMKEIKFIMLHKAKACLRADICRFISVKQLLTGIILVGLVFILSVADVINLNQLSLPAEERLSIIDQFQMNLTFDRYSSLLLLAVSIICVPGFADDYNTRFLQYLIHRGSLEGYAHARVIINAVIVLISMVFGILLAAACVSPFMRISAGGGYNDKFYNSLVTGDFACVYLILIGANFAFAILPVCNIGMIVSVIQPNRFVALGTTFFTFYLLYSLTNMLPLDFQYRNIACKPAGGISILWEFAVILILIILTGKCFTFVLQRRSNEGTL